jgi:hypothetical protein
MISRAIDTASWARPWFGLFVLPWLLAAWLAGAWLARPNGNLAWGAAGGLVLLAATTAAYLAAAGDAASTMAFRLTLLAIVAGPLFGLAGAAVHHGPGGRQLSVLALLAAVVGQAAVLTFIGPVPGGAGY